MDVPTEVLELIFRYISKKNLKSVRLVCKAWDRTVVPLLFDEVFISTCRADFEVALLIAAEFGQHIKTLTISTEIYLNMDVYEFQAKMKSWMQWRPYGLPKHLREHRWYGWENYCILEQEQIEDFETGSCLESLCTALKHLPKLQKIIIADGRRPDIEYPGGKMTRFSLEGQRRNTRHWRLPGPCPIDGCRVSLANHLKFQVTPESGLGASIGNPWELAMLAMTEVKPNIKELVLNPRNNFRINIFNPQLPYDLRDHMRSLNKLRLDLEFEHLDAELHNGSIANTLAVATQLRSFYLRMRGDMSTPLPMTLFQSCLRGCTFDKLESLFLDGLDSMAEELLQFVQGSARLKQITLYCHDLTTGAWETVADNIKDTCSLRSVELNMLFGGLPDDWLIDRDWPGYVDHLGSVEVFFLNKGPNPFTLETLQDCDRKIQDQQRPVKEYCHDKRTAEARYKLLF